MQIFPNALYQHYKGGLYQAIMPVINEADKRAMWVYRNKETGEHFVRPEIEFEKKFQFYIPFGTKLKGKELDFVVIHVGNDYYTLFCDSTKEELELKLMSVKSYLVCNHVVLQMKNSRRNCDFYQFVLNLKDL